MESLEKFLVKGLKQENIRMYEALAELNLKHLKLLESNSQLKVANAVLALFMFFPMCLTIRLWAIG